MEVIKNLATLDKGTIRSTLTQESYFGGMKKVGELTISLQVIKHENGQLDLVIGDPVFTYDS